MMQRSHTVLDMVAARSRVWAAAHELIERDIVPAGFRLAEMLPDLNPGTIDYIIKAFVHSGQIEWSHLRARTRRSKGLTGATKAERTEIEVRKQAARRHKIADPPARESIPLLGDWERRVYHAPKFENYRWREE